MVRGRLLFLGTYRSSSCRLSSADPSGVGDGSFDVSPANGVLQIPMVAPFLGCAFGGFLYDVFIFTGPSPINTPMLGLQRLMRPRRSVWSNTHQSAIETKV